MKKEDPLWMLATLAVYPTEVAVPAMSGSEDEVRVYLPFMKE